MSRISEYAATCERSTALNARTPTDLLEEAAPMFPNGFPVSGDMLAVLARDTRSRQYTRRAIWNRWEEGIEL